MVIWARWWMVTVAFALGVMLGFDLGKMAAVGIIYVGIVGVIAEIRQRRAERRLEQQ